MSTEPEPNEVKTSHDLADALRKLADRLTSAEPFNLDGTPRLWLHQYERQNFVQAVKVIGGTEQETSTDYFFTLVSFVDCLKVETSITRQTVCRLVTPAQPAVYERDPQIDAEIRSVS
jgi:hypothetical protein